MIQIDDLNEDKINGTIINYYFICHTKLWFFAHNIQMEDNSENVKLGKQLHENTYKRDKEFLIDNKINIDFIRKTESLEIHEIKKSRKMEKSHEYQLLYYIYYLKKHKNIENLLGFLDYPLIKKTREIHLTDEKEHELDNIIKNINNIIKLEKPQTPKKKNICKTCAYYELCFI